MRREEVELLSDATNRAVIRHPSRKFPGILVQGDTLKHLHGIASRLKLRIQSSKDQQLVDDVEELASALDEYLAHYETVLREHGISTPY